ncbi:Phytochelatin synthase-domain-containing protein [Phycomyces nitens]|nr:Phytochelatin synthase-domain-containing protein [Phycomyces nitens]
MLRLPLTLSKNAQKAKKSIRPLGLLVRRASFHTEPRPDVIPAIDSSPRSPSTFKDMLGINKPNPDLEKTFYQRQLPANLVRLASPEGKKLFRSAMEDGYAEGFFPLTGNYTTQSEPSYCGPSSLAMVLNALEVDPKRRWKGVWRWYSDELLDCCATQEDMKKNGITFNEFACLAKCHCDVIVKRASETTLEEFKRDVENVTSRSDQFMVISFCRTTLGQTGDGHFSPIAAYNPEAQMILVLDTARFKYPSFWCSLETLYESMKPIDKETGRPRGYFLLSYDLDNPPVKLCNGGRNKALKEQSEKNDPKETKETTETKDQHTTTESPVQPADLNWSTLAQSFCKRIPENMWLEKPRTLEHVVQLVLRNVPPEYTAILVNQSMASNSQSPEKAAEYIDCLLKDTSHSPLYPTVFHSLYPEKKYSPDEPADAKAVFATLFVLGSPRMLYTSLPRELQEKLEQYRKDDSMSSVVKCEIDRISVEVSELTKTFCTCGPGWTDQNSDSKTC